MLFGIFVLLACQLVGEALARLFALPVPGPVIGILALLLVLALAERRGGASAAAPQEPVGRAADGLLAYLGLLFVPAGVGIARSPDLVLRNGVGVLAALILSTVLTLLVTVGAFRWVRRRMGEGAS